jgi:hypothetical protein
VTTGSVGCNVSVSKNAYRETGQTGYASQQLLHSFGLILVPVSIPDAASITDSTMYVNFPGFSARSAKLYQDKENP